MKIRDTSPRRECGATRHPLLQLMLSLCSHFAFHRTHFTSSAFLIFSIAYPFMFWVEGTSTRCGGTRRVRYSPTLTRYRSNYSRDHRLLPRPVFYPQLRQFTTSTSGFPQRIPTGSSYNEVRMLGPVRASTSCDRLYQFRTHLHEHRLARAAFYRFLSFTVRCACLSCFVL